MASESPNSILTEYLPGTFTQWVADNIDHNVATLDGQGTFHGMGIIAVSTPKGGTTLTSNSRVIKRQKRMKVNELVKDQGVPITQYISPLKRGLSAVTFKPMLELQVPYTLPSEICFGMLVGFFGMMEIQHPIGQGLCSISSQMPTTRIPKGKYYFCQ